MVWLEHSFIRIIPGTILMVTLEIGRAAGRLFVKHLGTWHTANTLMGLRVSLLLLSSIIITFTASLVLTKPL